MRLGLSLALSSAMTAVGGPMSTITNLEVLATAVLPDGADAAIPNGWVAKVTLPYDSLATFDPTKIQIVTSDPGYSGTTPTTRNRSIVGTKIIRQQYPNGASILYTNAAGVATVYFALSEPVFAGTTLVSAQALTGYYGAAAAGSITSLTRSSVLAYKRPIGGPVNRQQERVTSGSLNIESYWLHEMARFGQQVSAVEYIATDGTNTVSAVSTTPALSNLISGSLKPEVYPATLNVSTLNQAVTSTDFCTVNMKVYPWIGTVFDVSVSGSAWPTANPDTQLRFVNDKNGTYGGAHVAVKVGAATGAVASTYAAAVANPYPTIEAALAALPAWNNTNKGHNDHSGATVWLMETSAGAGATHTPAAAMAPTAGSCWTEIKVDPAATGAVSVSVTALRTVSSLLSWQVNVSHGAATSALDGATANGNIMADFANMTLTIGTATTAPINYRCGLTWFRNVTCTDISNSGANPFFSNSAGVRINNVGVYGCTGTATTNVSVSGGLVLGNSFQRVRPAEIPSTYTVNDTLDGQVFANNLHRNNQQQIIMGDTRGFTKGLGFAQVVFEKAAVASDLFRIGGDNTTQTLSNILLFHVTIPGGTDDCRNNLVYNDVLGSVGVQKELVHLYCIFSKFNMKTDTYTTNTTATGRTGNWKARHHVGCRGSIVLAGDTAGNTSAGYAGPPGNWLGEVWPTDGNTNTTKAAVTFTNDQAGGVGFPGLGTYSLTGTTNAAYNRVAAGMAVFARDIVGTARRNDGSGAAGAYERTV